LKFLREPFHSVFPYLGYDDGVKISVVHRDERLAARYEDDMGVPGKKSTFGG